VKGSNLRSFRDRFTGDYQAAHKSLTRAYVMYGLGVDSPVTLVQRSSHPNSHPTRHNWPGIAAFDRSLAAGLVFARQVRSSCWSSSDLIALVTSDGRARLVGWVGSALSLAARAWLAEPKTDHSHWLVAPCSVGRRTCCAAPGGHARPPESRLETRRRTTENTSARIAVEGRSSPRRSLDPPAEA
jgi:hypothetical protein